MVCVCKQVCVLNQHTYTEREWERESDHIPIVDPPRLPHKHDGARDPQGERHVAQAPKDLYLLG